MEVGEVREVEVTEIGRGEKGEEEEELVVGKAVVKLVVHQRQELLEAEKLQLDLKTKSRFLCLSPLAFLDLPRFLSAFTLFLSTSSLSLSLSRPFFSCQFSVSSHLPSQLQVVIVFFSQKTIDFPPHLLWVTIEEREFRAIVFVAFGQ